MALITPPSWLQAGTYTAQSDRQNQQAVFNTTGVIGATSLAVTAQASPNMTVNIAAGWGAIVSSTSNAGVYGVYNDATVIQTISTADATNPRIDLIVATINDAQYSGSLNNVVFTTVAGTPAASPTVPTTPNNSIVLAQIAVAAGASTITTANITDRRVPVQNGLTNASYYVPNPGTNYSFTPADVQPKNIYAATGSGASLAANTLYEVEGVVRYSVVIGATSGVAVYCQLTYSGTAGNSNITFTNNKTTVNWGDTSGQTTIGTKPVNNLLTITGAATINSTNYITTSFKGFVRTTTAGTLTFQAAFNPVTGLVTSDANSYMKVTPVGGAALTTVGTWS